MISMTELQEEMNHIKEISTEIEEIAGRMIDTLKDRLKAMDIVMEFNQEVRKLVAKAGFDPVYGARPLRRALQNNVEDILSEEILSGKITAGNKYICKVENSKIMIEKINDD